MKEKRINYLQVLYYTIAGVVVGILVGAIDAVFGRVLLAITDFRGQHVMVLVPFLGAAGVLILFLYQKFSPKAQKGMGLIFDTGFEENEKIPPALVPLIMVSTWLTHLFGGSAGREGVAVQIGATLSHAVGRCLEKTPLGKTVSVHHGRIFLIIGMAAGFGGLFQTPLAALGYAAVFGSATNTLLAPILIGIEVFGAEQAILFAIVCMIAFVCNGNRTIYGKQRISQMLDFEKK